MSVKRYFFNAVETIDGLGVWPIEDSEGDYISASDFDALSLKLAEAEAKVRELQKTNKELHSHFHRLEEKISIGSQLAKITELETANAVLKKKLEKCKEQRDKLQVLYNGCFETVHSLEEDSCMDIDKLNLALSAITAESIAKTEGVK